ncbi:6-phosphofructo-2-kinase/fructose-2,6-bisphosphatase-like [Symsagittifera roscoffensis]|uniref:6-phosphofructo-2-kinase/fructose-2, 6-bisphosphatase-like n=1 Tax=Symsagittifera roscoffensis TaxID=84072 RepID=UPI00307BE556
MFDLDGDAANSAQVVSSPSRFPDSVTTCLTIPSHLINSQGTEKDRQTSYNAAFLTDIDSNNSYSVPWLLNAVRGKPLLVSLVGLPGRGKTIIAHKLHRFLLWNKIRCEVFHLSYYRRQMAPDFPEHVINQPLKSNEEPLRAECFKMLFEDIDLFFSEGLKHVACMNDTGIAGGSSTSTLKEFGGKTSVGSEDMPFLQQVRGNVAIFDFANSRKSYRRELVEFCHSRDYDLCFLESITDDLNLIQLYIAGIEQSNPDYLNMSREAAVVKFENHFRDYADSYEQLDEQSENDLAFLKIFDGGVRFRVHNMNGYMQSKMVYYLMSLHFARQPIYITRHGEALNNTLGIVGGDSELTARGVKYADAFADFINNLPEMKQFQESGSCCDGPGLQVWASVLKRAQQTAARLKSPVLCWNALRELDAGVFDGKTYDFIEAKFPQEAANRRFDKFKYRYPDGESYDDLVTRLEPVIMELERTRSTIVIVCHQAVMRCLMAYLLNRSFDELPYLDVPLHHLFKITPTAYGYEAEDINLNVPSNEYTNSRERRKKSSVLGKPANFL